MVLQSIRERLTGVLAFVILGILIVPFALVGVTQYFTAADGNIVAWVNETDITSSDFNQSFSTYRRRMQSIMGAAYDPVQFDQLTVRREHLERLIDQELVVQAADSMGLDVDDETLAAEIRQIPAFQVDGQFNADVYQSRLIAQGLSPRQFQQQIRVQFITSQLPMSVTTSSIATPAEMKEYIALSEQERTFSAILVPADVPETPPEFDEDTITAWYESHSNEFQSEEQVVIEYLELDAAFLPPGLPPEEDDLREQFEAQKGRFISPEQRHVAHILIEVTADADEAVKETARQTAEDLSKRARAGEDFAELAKEHSQDMGSASGGGDLGWVEPGFMVKAFENAMYELAMASPISEPVQTGFGWHVIQLQEIRESSGMSFDEARMLLVTEYEEDQAGRAFLEQADRLVDLIYEDPTTLESAAMVMELPVNTVGPFSRRGGEGISANADVIQASFSDLVLLQGSVSDPVNLGQDRLVMIRSTEHFPVTTKPLDEVREEIVATLSDNLARDNAEAQAVTLLAVLQSGASDSQSLAIASSLEFANHEAVRRNTSVPDAKLVQEIFRLAAPAEDGKLQKVLPTSDGFAIVELTAVVNGELDEGALIAKQQYQRLLANSIASQEAYALMRQLRSVAEIQIFEERIQ